MSETTSGYMLTIRGFLPADPGDLQRMARVASDLRDLPSQLREIFAGLADVTVEHRFVARHRSRPGSPAAAPTAVTDAQTPGLFTEAAAAPATAAAASAEYQEARAGGAPSEGPQVGEATQELDGAPAAEDARPPVGPESHRRVPQQAPEVSGSGGHCAHERRRQYLTGDFCLDCQAGPLAAGEELRA